MVNLLARDGALLRDSDKTRIISWGGMTRALHVFNAGAQLARVGRSDLSNSLSWLNILDIRTLFPDEKPWVNTGQDLYKRAVVIHHDAVAFKDEDKNFNGSTLDESLDRLKVIYDYHRNVNGVRDPSGASWNGIGYHIAIDPAGRAFLCGALDTHRAHTLGSIVGTGGLAAEINEVAIGIVFLGNYADSLAQDGKPLPPLLDRPTKEAIATLVGLIDFLLAGLGRQLEVHPHKFYQPDTVCPGTWTRADSWGLMTPQAPQPVAPVPLPPVPPGPLPADPAITTPLAQVVVQYQKCVDELVRLGQLISAAMP